MIDWKQVGYGINAPGLQVQEFQVADKWGMAEDPYRHLLVPIPLSGEGFYERRSDHASLTDTLFLADCIGFDHECPTMVVPYIDDAPSPYEAIGHSRPWVQEGVKYWEALEECANYAYGFRFTDGPAFRYSTQGDPLADFDSRFAGRREPLSLYMTAIRQVDFLSEYIGLYRVLEWPKKDNGKEFIEAHLDTISNYDFGTLIIEPPVYPPDLTQDHIEVFEVLRDRAVGRVEALRTADVDIARHLYAIRNRLAHGKDDFVVNDYGQSVDGVVADIPLVKLLARIAVERAADIS